MLRTPYIEYGNSDRATLSSTSTDLDHIRVDFYELWFVRSLPSMVVVMVLNLVVVLSIDRLINRHTWRRLGGGYKVHVTTTNTHDDDKTNHDLFLVAQDPDGIDHLYDARKHEV
ncbi:hypothetical protein AaE_000853 [Aphanomyces astaci]|uniref:Uncharacterized protein n=1 Tax=Aphanomyces astaci TaxID=112090 RepID=A0A6A5AXY0_APHAT|nr:hypothetical protein AaE_000853 [Aphanomyces astaci]